jgi:hypothetical protein
LQPVSAVSLFHQYCVFAMQKFCSFNNCLWSFVGILVFIYCTDAVLYGDENYLDLPNGRFWAFYSGGVALINPDTCVIENTITQDNEGMELPEGWSDGIYMQYHKREAGVSQSELDEGIEGYVLINSRIDRTNSAGDRVSNIYVFGSVSEKVESIIEVGPRVVHGYGIHTHDEFWTHSDGDGHFYVVELSDIKKHQGKVPALDALPFHGKLLWDEDGTLGNRGYATSTGEQFLFQVNLIERSLTDKYDFSMDVVNGTCFGLHGIAYSGVNQHIFCECVGGGGILEFDVSGETTAFVAQHLEANGSPYELPDGSYVVAASQADKELNVFRPQATGARSTIEHTISVLGRPATPEFYPTDNVAGGADYIACMPLTSNPNAAQIDSDGEVACDFFNGCTGAMT